MFLFILFFQPFPFEEKDLNNLILTVSGFGFILFLIILLVRVMSSLLFERHRKLNEDAIFPAYFNGVAIFLAASLAFGFYAHFTAGVHLSFTVAIRILIICLIPPIILGVMDTFHDLKHHNEQLVTEKKNIQTRIEKYEDDILNKSVEFISESTNESLNLTVSEVVFMRSSDNYVEIVYKETDSFKKKLIRNTLKNVESQVRQYSIFIRCHRTCIINQHFIEKLHKNSGNQWLSIKGYDEKLPVSRQYLLRIQESL